jgi:molecular chaperone DnaK (HSP70)
MCRVVSCGTLSIRALGCQHDNSNGARVMPALKRLLGTSISGSNVVSYRHDYPSTKLVTWQHNHERIAVSIDDHHIGIEEGIAMIFQHSLVMAREHARVSITYFGSFWIRPTH